ncbi:lysophospholipid acyltransferase family protein [Granulicella arctica]|uniref:lysophospholipid acyltransferase family protein n=1 Tax=Granulicella arctica TaxID=940613 RepID=UPI0021E0319D|nr:lysophospholipid acyltransferase family protein [Granulicella arctica]
MNVPKISAPILRFFRRIVRGYFRRHFHAVRIQGAERFVSDGGPLIIYANHSSWWDPMVSILLADTLMPTLRHYAPMDAEALRRYPILKRLGIFPIEMKTMRGAAQFLRLGEAILQQGGALWVTPEGRFTDARQRPLLFKPGLAALANRMAKRSGRCTLIPLAIEYPFWNERLPDTLLYVGSAVQVSNASNLEEVQGQLIAGLESAMNTLKELAVSRDASRFATLLGGRSGTGGFYALGQRIKAFVQRRPYQAEHTSTAKPEVVGE